MEVCGVLGWFVCFYELGDMIFFFNFFLLVPFCEFAYEAMGECLESIFWKNVLFYRKLLPLNVH